MLQYISADKSIQTGKIGQAKMIRIYRLEKLKNLVCKDALFAALYTDVKFLTGQLSAIEQVYAKTKDYANTIVSVKHVNHEISHIAINYTDENCPPQFKLEIVGTEGIVDYNSEKALSVYGSTPFDKNCCVDYSSYSVFMKDDNDQTVMDVISMIERSIINKKPVRRGV